MAEERSNDKGLLRVMVWGSCLAVGVSLALTFSVHTAPDATRLEFSFASLFAFVAGFVGTWFFWNRLFKLMNEPRRMWRFIIASSVLFIAVFIGCIFLPQFAPIAKKSDLVEGMLMGFGAVAVVLLLARVVFRLFEDIDGSGNDR